MAKKWLIGLDPGHGYPDEWNRGPTGYIEAHGVLDIALACRDELSRNGIDVLMSREGRQGLLISKRAQMFNAANVDRVVSIHTNAPGRGTDPASVRGVMAIHSYAPVQGIGRELALMMVDQLTKDLSIPKWGRDGTWTRTYKKGGRTYDYYGIIRLTKAPAVICEVEYHTHPEAEQLLKTPAFRQWAGVSIAHAVMKQLEIKPLPPDVSISDHVAVLPYGPDDYPAARRLAVRVGGAVYQRTQIPWMSCKVVYVVGGPVEEVMSKARGRVVSLSGADYFETAEAVKNYLGGEK